MSAKHKAKNLLASRPKNLLGRQQDEEPTHLAEPDRREIVAEAALTFGAAAAGELAGHLGLTLADAADEIAHLRRLDQGARHHG